MAATELTTSSWTIGELSIKYILNPTTDRSIAVTSISEGEGQLLVIGGAGKVITFSETLGGTLITKSVTTKLSGNTTIVYKNFGASIEIYSDGTLSTGGTTPLGDSVLVDSGTLHKTVTWSAVTSATSYDVKVDGSVVGNVLSSATLEFQYGTLSTSSHTVQVIPKASVYTNGSGNILTVTGNNQLPIPIMGAITNDGSNWWTVINLASGSDGIEFTFAYTPPISYSASGAGTVAGGNIGTTPGNGMSGGWPRFSYRSTDSTATKNHSEWVEILRPF